MGFVVGITAIFAFLVGILTGVHFTKKSTHQKLYEQLLSDNLDQVPKDHIRQVLRNIGAKERA